MRTLIAVATAGLIAVAAICVWSNAPSRSTTDASLVKATLVPSMSVSKALVPAMSLWEMHNQAHLENIPIQEVDDKTVIFTAEAPR